MKYYWLKAIALSMLTIFFISLISIMLSSFEKYLNNLRQTDIQIGVIMMTISLTLLLIPLFKYIEEKYT